jgi:hypothetical protein
MWFFSLVVVKARLRQDITWIKSPFTSSNKKCATPFKPIFKKVQSINLTGILCLDFKLRHTTTDGVMGEWGFELSRALKDYAGLFVKRDEIVLSSGKRLVTVSQIANVQHANLDLRMYMTVQNGLNAGVARGLRRLSIAGKLLQRVDELRNPDTNEFVYKRTDRQMKFCYAFLISLLPPMFGDSLHQALPYISRVLQLPQYLWMGVWVAFTRREGKSYTMALMNCIAMLSIAGFNGCIISASENANEELLRYYGIHMRNLAPDIPYRRRENKFISHASLEDHTKISQMKYFPNTKTVCTKPWISRWAHFSILRKLCCNTRHSIRSELKKSHYTVFVNFVYAVKSRSQRESFFNKQGHNKTTYLSVFLSHAM